MLILRLSRLYRLLRKSGYFDDRYYLLSNPEVRKADIDALSHYISHGWREGRNPSAFFDVSGYLEKYPDVRDAGIEPLFHYLCFGMEEGRNSCKDQNEIVHGKKHFKDDVHVSEKRMISGRLSGATRGTVAYSRKMLQLFYMAIKNPSLLVYVCEKLKANGYKSTINEILGILNKSTPCPRQEYENAAKYCLIVQTIDGYFKKHTRGHPQEQNNILLISHDLIRAGAPLLLLNIAKHLREVGEKNILIISLVDGELRGEFEKYCTVLCLNQSNRWTIENASLVDCIFRKLSDNGVNKAIGNTTGSALFVPYLEKCGFVYQILIHEMPETVEFMGWDKTAALRLSEIASGRAVYSSEYVLGKHRQLYALPYNVEVIPQGMFQVQRKQRNAESRADLLSRYKLPKNARLILHGGKDLVRKGLDLFVDIAFHVSSLQKNIYFVYLCDKYELTTHKELVKKIADSANIIIDNFTSDYGLYLEGSDLYALTSRADPFPNTVLDALSHGLPVIAFDECGGAPELLRQIDDCLVAKRQDVQDFARKVSFLLDNPSKYKEISGKSIDIIRRDYRFEKYVDRLQSFFDAHSLHKVSVIVPNYDFSEFLPERLHSIINQTLMPYEIIFLDDKSSDDSCLIAEGILADSRIKYKIVKNDSNQGVLKQWQKGIEMAEGELVWIADAADYCDRNLLMTLVPRFGDPDISLAYCHARLVDADGVSINDDGVLLHANDIDDLRWRHSFVCKGTHEIYRGFLYRNLISNSGVCVFRRNSCAGDMLEQLKNYKYVGDWFLYASLMSSGKIFHSHKVLASFRRHQKAITTKSMNSNEYVREVMAVIEMMMKTHKVSERSFEKIRFHLKKDHNIELEQYGEDLARLLANMQEVATILFVSTNPCAQEGGGSDVLWYEAAKTLSIQNYPLFLNVYKRSNMPHRVGVLRNIGVTISYYEETGLSILDEIGVDLVIIIQGDEREGSDWCETCKNKKIPYVIVNQLTRPDVEINSNVKEGYLNASKVFFTCENNRLLMQEKIGRELGNAERHYNPVAGIERGAIMPFPEVIGNRYYLACPARLMVIHKGQDLLFEVLKQDKWKDRQLHINLYGDGPDKEMLQEMKKTRAVDNVVFCGYERDVCEIWKRNHGIIMPSRMEGVPIVLLGAMFCGRVPILTDVGGHRELVQDGVAGFIANAPTVEDVDAALERAWRQRANWSEIGRKAREAVLAFQSEDPVKDFVDKILGQV